MLLLVDISAAEAAKAINATAGTGDTEEMVG